MLAQSPFFKDFVEKFLELFERNQELLHSKGIYLKIILNYLIILLLDFFILPELFKQLGLIILVQTDGVLVYSAGCFHQGIGNVYYYYNYFL